MYRGAARHGVIDVVTGADLTVAVRAAIPATAGSEWKPVARMFDGEPKQTGQARAEVRYVPA